MVWLSDPYRLYQNLLENPEGPIASNPVTVRDICNILGNAGQYQDWTYSEGVLRFMNEPRELCAGLDQMLEMYQPDHLNYVGSYQYPRYDNKYVQITKLGSGTFGTVFSSKLFGNNVVVKVSKITTYKNPPLNEAAILCRLAHPNILTPIDVMIDRTDSGLKLLLVLPMAESDLYRLRFDRPEIATSESLARDLCLGLLYLHEIGLWHRDIKPGNCLLYEGRGVISDFGTVAGPACFQNQIYQYGGTVNYTSVEQLLGDTKFNQSADWWAMGCTFYYLITHRHLFSVEKHAHLQEIGQYLGNSRQSWPSIIEYPKYPLYSELLASTLPPQLSNMLNPYSISESYRDLIVGCVAYPSVRWTPEQIKASPIVSNVSDTGICRPRPDECVYRLDRGSLYPNYGTLPSRPDLIQHYFLLGPVINNKNLRDISHTDLILWRISELTPMSGHVAWILSRIDVIADSSVRYPSIPHISNDDILNEILSVADELNYDLNIVTWYEYLPPRVAGPLALRIAEMTILVGMAFLYHNSIVSAAITVLFDYYNRIGDLPDDLNLLGRILLNLIRDLPEARQLHDNIEMSRQWQIEYNLQIIIDKSDISQFHQYVTIGQLSKIDGPTRIQLFHNSVNAYLSRPSNAALEIYDWFRNGNPIYDFAILKKLMTTELVNEVAIRHFIELYPGTISIDLWEPVITKISQRDVRTDEDAQRLRLMGTFGIPFNDTIITRWFETGIAEDYIPEIFELINTRIPPEYLIYGTDTILTWMINNGYSHLINEGLRRVQLSPGHLNGHDVAGRRPLELAVMLENTDTVIELLNHGADPNFRSSRGHTLFEMTIMSDNLLLMRSVAEYIDPDFLTGTGQTAFDLVASARNISNEQKRRLYNLLETDMSVVSS